MLRLQSDRYEYTAPTGAAFCGLKVFDVDTRTIVVFTEQPDNPGMSVTNFADGLATSVVSVLGLDPARTVFVEHWPPMDGRDESFDLIHFRWRDTMATAPNWFRFPVNTFADVIKVAAGLNL